jgi:protein-S-isoprenylcysteine O-methyltransferase Ste14
VAGRGLNVFAVATAAVGLACAVALTVIIGVSVLPVDYRVWPPGADDRKRRVYTTLSRTFLLAMLVTAALDWGTWMLPWPARVVGAAVFVGGFLFFARSGVDLGEETRGTAGELRTDGLYRYTRNPQVVAGVVTFVGIGLLADSALVAGLVAALLCWLPATVFAEEPWLQEQYGEPYDEYRRDVPRFVGTRTVRQALAALR